MRLSVLDQSPIAEGSTGRRRCAARSTSRATPTRSATTATGSPSTTAADARGAFPEVLIGPVASATERIRVGSGGVMLPHYSPFKVAESFSVLAGLFPGRIDLALGRASGTDPLTTFALQRDRRDAAPDDFPQQLTELLGYLYGTSAQGPSVRAPDAARRARAARAVAARLLAQSAIWAGELGLPYAFADFINPGGAEIAALYRERFAAEDRRRPGHSSASPAICAETDEEAQSARVERRMAFTLLRERAPDQVPPVERRCASSSARGPGRSGRRWVVGHRRR